MLTPWGMKLAPKQLNGQRRRCLESQTLNRNPLARNPVAA